MRLAPLFAALLLTSLTATAANPITLSQAMADPDWIGPPVEDAWWRWDGQAAQYLLKRDGASIRDTWQVGIDGTAATHLDGAALADIDGSDAVFDTLSTRTAFVRNGDVFVRDLRSGALTQLTRTLDRESRPQLGRDGGLVWRVGNAWYRWDGHSVGQVALLKTEDAPGKIPKADDLRDRQLRLIDTLRNDRARRDAAREQDEAWRAADSTRAAAPTYLGKDVDIVDSALSPDGRWLLVATTEKGADAGTEGKLPKYVTESGYEEFEAARTRVGRGDPLPQKLFLAETATGNVRELEFDRLPGIKDDPLAALRKAAGKEPLKGNRAVQVSNSEDDGNAPTLRWTSDGSNAAVMIRAIDNKDRWIATIDLANAALQPRNRLHDDAWINWSFNDFGWLPDDKTLWYLSEESGYSHLYTLNGSTRTQLTDGRWETSEVQVSRDGSA
ncbi:MAG: DPP IV N-terminal domain-containing protein, partial [Thermomonas sp.]